MRLQRVADSGALLPRQIRHDQPGDAALAAARRQPFDPVGEQRVVVTHQHQRHARVAVRFKFLQNPLEADAVGQRRFAGALYRDSVRHGVGEGNPYFDRVARGRQLIEYRMKVVPARVPGGKERQQRRLRCLGDGAPESFGACIRATHGRTLWGKPGLLRNAGAASRHGARLAARGGQGPTCNLRRRNRIFFLMRVSHKRG